MNNELYLDSNATTSVLPSALDAAVRVLNDNYANPSSTHSAGLRAKAIMEESRARACRVLGVGEGRLMFNSGATEGIQTAVLSALCAVRERLAEGGHAGRLIVFGATEHKAVPESLAHWNRVLGLDLEIRELGVDSNGRHDLAMLRLLAPQAALVCTMAANNETGAISDLDGIEASLEGSEALWLVDCVQALGKLQLRLSETRIDYAPFSGHKLYAPKGVGMLYVRAGAPYTPLMIGGGQESGMRSGTENMSGIAALGTVLAELEAGTSFRSHAELATLRQRLAASLVRSFPGLVFNTPLEMSLPTTLNVTVPGLSSGQLLDVFDAAGIRVSAGSACSAARSLPSYVLEAMGFPAWRSSSAVRISLGAASDDASVEAACRRIEECGEALRASGLLDETAATPVEASIASTTAPSDALSPDALLRLIGQCPALLLVDVREQVEHAVSHLPGHLHEAINVPLGHLSKAAPGWLASADRPPIVFFCRSGNRSARAASYLRELGYQNALHLGGGLALGAAPLEYIS